MSIIFCYYAVNTFPPHIVISNKCTSTFLGKKRYFSSHLVNRVYIYKLKLCLKHHSKYYLQVPIFNLKSLLFPQSPSPRVLTQHSGVVRCCSQSTGPLINRLELLTGGSSISCRPCHFHCCVSIRPQSGGGARKERGAAINTSPSLAF